MKICGVTIAEEAAACVELGANAIGVNFVASSNRVVSVQRAREISRAVGARALVVGVVANLDVAAMNALANEAELGCLQLHGDETPETLAAMLPHAYKAVRVAAEVDVAGAAAFSGDYILVDAKVPGVLGGTGVSFDWSLVRDLARARKLTLAGGLTKDNVADAVRIVRPYCVDVSSGVERDGGPPGGKDLAKVRTFIDRARGASS